MVCDCSLPDLTGVELLSDVRGSDDLRAMRVLMTSDGEKSEDVVSALKSGADDFVVLCQTEGDAHAARDDTATALKSLKLTLEPSKTGVTEFDAGFDYLGVHFERDEYSYLWEGKRITVEGDFPDFLFAYGPEYE